MITCAPGPAQGCNHGILIKCEVEGQLLILLLWVLRSRVTQTFNKLCITCSYHVLEGDMSLLLRRWGEKTISMILDFISSIIEIDLVLERLSTLQRPATQPSKVSAI